jgi:hypothetical protein
VWWFVVVFISSTASYGWTISTARHGPGLGELPPPPSGAIAAPLILQFIIAFSAAAISCTVAGLVVELSPDGGVGSTAANGLFSLGLGAAAVPVASVGIGAIGPGFTFLACAGAVAAMTPPLALERRHGPEWREARERQLRALADEENAGSHDDNSSGETSQTIEGQSAVAVSKENHVERSHQAPGVEEYSAVSGT